MRTSVSGFVTVRAVSGTSVVFLACNMRKADANGLMGFAIQRTDLVEDETTWLRGNKTLIRSDLKGHGIGWRLMAIMIEYAKWLGLDVVEGQVLRENSTMLAMCQSLGFKTRLDPDDPTVMMVTLPVQQVEVPAPDL